MEVTRFAQRSTALLAMVTALGACAGQVVAAPDAAPPAGTAPSSSDWRSLVNALASHPEILMKDWAAIRAVLPAGCFRDANNGDVACPPMEGVVRMSVVPGPRGIIDIVLKTPPASCEALYASLSPRFGKGELENGDKCYAEWKLGKQVKGGNVNYSPGRKDPTQLHLQFAVEQGP